MTGGDGSAVYDPVIEAGRCLPFATEHHLRARPLLAVLLSLGLAGGTLAASAQASPAAPDGRVRLSGDLVRTSVEPAGSQPSFGVLVDGRLVPVAGDELTTTTGRARVTIDVAVPQTVADAAAAGRTLHVPTTKGGARHDLHRADLAAAADATPAAADSDIAAASIDTALAPGSEPLEVTDLAGATQAAASYTPATRAITYVEVTPRGMEREPVTKTPATQQVASADGYWRDQSRSEIKIGAPSMRTHYTSAYSCADDPIARFQEAADRVGYAFRDNSSLVLRLPRAAEAGCGYGLGIIGDSPNDWGVLHVADSRWPVLAHELGHNMSYGHANSLVCSGRSDDTERSGEWSTCREEGYGDALDVMGISGDTAGMLSAPQALATGMLASAASVSVGAGTSTVTLKPVSGRAGVRAAVVTHRRTGVKYWVEYRTATGRDATNPTGQSTGVRVLRRNSQTGDTVLLDPTPTGAHDRSMSLAVGRTLSSSDGKITVTTQSASATEAVVRMSNTSTPGTFSLVSSPRITGTKGVGSTLTASTGSWSPTPTSYSYQWRRNGVAISGATGRTYRATTWDAGRYLTVTVTARRSHYTSRSVTSAKVGIPIHATTRPSISGTPRVGSTLTVMVGTWTPMPSSYSYRWYRDGAAISGASAKTYTVRSADRGHKVQAKVTARRTGYVTGSKLTYSVVPR